LFQGFQKTYMKIVYGNDDEFGFSQSELTWILRSAALITKTLAKTWAGHSYAYRWLEKRIKDGEYEVRIAALEGIVKYFGGFPEAFHTLCQCIQDTTSFGRMYDDEMPPAQIALEYLLTHYPTHPKLIALLHDRAINDPDEQLREWAQEQLEKMEGGRQ